MLAWIGKLLAGSFVQSEIKKIKAELEGAVKQVDAMKMMKQQLYTLADSILAEGQTKSKEQLDAWFVQKRAELKTWAGQ